MFLILSVIIFLLQNQRTGRPKILPGIGGGGGTWERDRRMIMCKQCVHMYVNAKMLKLFQESGEGAWGEKRPKPCIHI
jgi:hypothetical protein